MTMTEDLAKRHYAEHDGKPFFGELVEFITSGPLVAMVLEGDRGDQGRAPGDRRHEPARGGAGLDPRRLRDRGRPEHGPRLRLARVGRARGRAVLPRPLILGLAPRRSGGRSSTQAGIAVRGAPGRRRGGRPTGDPARCGRENARRKALRGARRRCRSAPTRSSRSTARSSASRATPPRRASTSRASTAARTRSSAGSRSRARRDRGDAPSRSRA